MPYSLEAALGYALIKIAHNHIVSIRPLAKAHFKYLTELSLEGNEINEFSCLSEMNCGVGFDLLSLEK